MVTVDIQEWIMISDAVVLSISLGLAMVALLIMLAAFVVDAWQQRGR